MAAGAELVAATPTEVAGRGWPVTTPRELVWVRKEVNPLVYGTLEEETGIVLTTEVALTVEL
jgi:hypothetical protein